MPLITSASGKRSEVVTPDQIIEALNQPPLPTDEVQEVDAFLVYQEKSSRGMNKFVFPYLSSPGFGKIFERRLISTKLRVYVDEWIASGILGDGGDSPMERSLLKAREATKFLRQFAKQSRPRLFLFPPKLEFVVMLDGENDYPMEQRAPGKRLGPRSWADLAMEKTAQLFAGMMMSDWPHTICKCRYCGIYFVQERIRKTSYPYGIYCCREHRQRASAQACTTKRRQRIKSTLVSFAARSLCQQGIRSADWQNDLNRKTTLVKDINRHIRKDGGSELRKYAGVVHINWVTTNQVGIERARIQMAKAATLLR
jgi:hypothetical protein